MHLTAPVINLLDFVGYKASVEHTKHMHGINIRSWKDLCQHALIIVVHVRQKPAAAATRSMCAPSRSISDFQKSRYIYLLTD